MKVIDYIVSIVFLAILIGLYSINTNVYSLTELIVGVLATAIILIVIFKQHSRIKEISK